MEKATKEFILYLLERELSAELIQQNLNPIEVEYVNDLINASRDFAKVYGKLTDKLYIEELVKEIKND